MSSGIRRNIVQIPCASFFCNSLHVAALEKCLQWIRRQPLRSAPFLNCRSNISVESILQQRLCTDELAVHLRRGKGSVINQGSLSKQLLSHANGLDGLLNFAFQIVALIDHVRDVGLLPGLPLVVKNLVEDSKDLISID